MDISVSGKVRKYLGVLAAMALLSLAFTGCSGDPGANAAWNVLGGISDSPPTGGGGGGGGESTFMAMCQSEGMPAAQCQMMWQTCVNMYGASFCSNLDISGM